MVSAVSTVLIAVSWVLVATSLSQALLGAYVLNRGGRRPHARLLGAYLLLQPFAFGAAFFLLGKAWQGGVSVDAAGVLVVALILQGFLPGLLVAFAAAYPTAPAGRARWWMAAPFLLPAANAVATAAVLFPKWVPGDGATADRAILVSFLFSLFHALAGSVAAFAIFLARRRRAATALERRRFTYMVRVLGAPLLLITVFVASLMVFMLTRSPDSIGASAAAILVQSFVLGYAAISVVPGVAMALGVLRYRVLDLDAAVRRTFRFTVSKGVLASVFLALFFLVGEGAQLLVESRTNSGILGLIFASVVVFAVTPLHRAAERIADRAVPASKATEKYQEFRRWEVYRATFEELSHDAVTPAEERILGSLARSLGLSDGDRSTIEQSVRGERSHAADAGGRA